MRKLILLLRKFNEYLSFISSTGLGRGEFYIDLVNEMSLNKDFKITLLVPVNAKFLPRVSKDINIIEYKSKDTRTNPFLYIELFNIFKNNRFDIVHTHFAKASELFFKLNKILRLKHIATKHNPRKGKIFNKIKYVTAVSIDVSKSIKKDEVKVIYNGVSPIEIEKKQTSNDIFTLSAIGRLDKIKGFDKLIKEMSKVQNRCVLNIIGDGEEYNNLSNLIKKYKLEDRVKLAGFKENIPEILAQSDMVIMTSLSEGFSLVMLESIFYAKLFVSTKVSGCKDILSSKLLIEDFEIASKIDDIILNYDEYILEFEEIKHKYQSLFMLKNISDEYIKYYKYVLL